MPPELDTCAILTEWVREMEATYFDEDWKECVREIVDRHNLHFYYNAEGLAVVSTERLLPEEDENENE